MNLAERKQLFQDIKNVVGDRAHGFVFAAQVDMDEDRDGDGEDYIFSWNGSITLANGLLVRAIRRFEAVDEIMNQDAIEEKMAEMEAEENGDDESEGGK
jgi:hypothetical protein